MLPRIKLFFENGALGKVTTPADGVMGLVCSGTAVGTTLALATAYVVRNMAMVQALGITPTYQAARQASAAVAGVAAQSGWLNIGTLGNVGSQVTIAVDGTVIGTYERIAGDATTEDLELGLAAAVNLNTASHTYTCTRTVGDGIRITAPLAAGATANGKVVQLAWSNGNQSSPLGSGVTAQPALTALPLIDTRKLHKTCTEFYSQAGEGAELWLMVLPMATPMADMVSIAADNATKLINAANGRLRGLMLAYDPGTGYSHTTNYNTETGMDTQVLPTLAAAQALTVWAKDVRFAPLFVAIEAYGYTGNAVALANLKTQAKNGVCVLLGDAAAGSRGAAIGLLAGRLASTPVQRNIGRVKDGALAMQEAWLYNTEAELADVETVHNKGYITFRAFVGKSGYFFADDPMATADTDDYSQLTARRTIDKAYRIAYESMLEELLDEVPVTSAGTLQLPIVKAWEGKLEAAIASGMTANGELSADVTDANDKGVKVYIDPDQNIISNSVLDVSLRVRPFGYPRYINVYLGFQVIAG